MQIALGVNYHGNLVRHQLAKQTHLKLQALYHGTLKVYDIQFDDELGDYDPIESTIYLPVLERSSKDFYPDWDRKFPLVNECFEKLSKQNCDYFIFTNDDVLVGDRLIKFIIDKQPNCFACSRLDINPIEKLSDPMIPYRWEIGGFDTFIFKKEWYLKYQFLFEDFFLGRPWYDHHYAALMKTFGGNVEIGNKNPAMCVHLHHGWAACSDDNPGYDFNNKNFHGSKFRKFDKPWDDYWLHILTKRRTPSFFFLNEYENERTVEKEFFDIEIIKLQPEIDLVKKEFGVNE